MNKGVRKERKIKERDKEIKEIEEGRKKEGREEETGYMVQ